METRFVEANGVRFGYFESGSGPLVLLVHGFPDTAHSWDFVRPKVAEAGFRSVAIFTRGYAPSSIPTNGKYDSTTLGEDLLALIGALGEQNAIVVGHDWGASAAYAAAALGPSRVKKLITVGIPHPNTVLLTPRVLWMVRHFFRFQFRDSEALVRRNDFAHVDELVQRWSPAWRVPAGETDAVKAAFREPGCLDAALGYYRELRHGLPASHRKKISVDTVAFAGLDDNVDVRAYRKAKRQFTGRYEIVTMPGGHFMHREHPQRFVDELLRVLRE
jgi:pimeloyl-ACP methyl ester carboxylesterase